MHYLSTTSAEARTSKSELAPFSDSGISLGIPLKATWPYGMRSKYPAGIRLPLPYELPRG